MVLHGWSALIDRAYVTGTQLPATHSRPWRDGNTGAKVSERLRSRWRQEDLALCDASVVRRPKTCGWPGRAAGAWRRL
jgi:hypothetical protein